MLLFKLQWETIGKRWCENLERNNNNNNIQTDHLIPARRTDLIIINKKRENLQNSRLAIPADCGTIASRHLVGRWFRDYHMCRLVFLCFFPRPRCFQIRGKRRWMRSSRWRLEFVLERRKSCRANFKKCRK